MKQLTNTDKQQLETKIEEEKERQRTLRERYPNSSENSKETSAGTEFGSSYLWKYGFLALILACLPMVCFSSSSGGSLNMMNSVVLWCL